MFQAIINLLIVFVLPLATLFHIYIRNLIVSFVSNLLVLQLQLWRLFIDQYGRHTVVNTNITHVVGVGYTVLAHNEMPIFPNINQNILSRFPMLLFLSLIFISVSAPASTNECSLSGQPDIQFLLPLSYVLECEVLTTQGAVHLSL